MSYNGVSLSHRQLVKSLTDRFGEDILVLSGNGVTSILVFKSKATGHLKIVSNDDDDNVDITRRIVTSKTVKSKQLKHDQTKYNTRITLQDCISASSHTLLSLMSTISSKLDSTLSAAMIGNIVTSAVTNKPTCLQISVGVVVGEKSAIELLSDFGITGSYDEVL